MKPFIVAGLGLLFVVGCGGGPKSGKGFALPDGNAETGKTLFLDFNCHECHTVSGVELAEPEPPAEKRHSIGGEVSRIQTYGELVSSVINPSHKLAKGYSPPEGAAEGESPMENYNHVMTVQELIDVVAFLQSRYELREYDPPNYPVYY